MSKTFIEWMATETPTRWCVDRGNVVDVKKAIAQGFEFGAGNPLLTLKSIKMEWDRMEKEVEDTRHLKGKERSYELYRRYMLPVFEAWMPVFEKYESGNRGRQCVMVNPNAGHDYEEMVEAGLMMSKWAPNVSIKIPVTQAGLVATEELAARGVHVTGTVGYSVTQGVQFAEAHARGVRRAKAAGIKPHGANFALFTLRLNQWVEEHAKGAGYSYIDYDVAKWAGIAVAKRINNVYDDFGYIDDNDLWFVPAAIETPHSLLQFVGGRVHCDLYWPVVERLNEHFKDAPREYHYDDPIDPDALDRLMGSSLFRQMYEYDGIPTEDLLTFGPIPHIAALFGTMGFDMIANL